VTIKVSKIKQSKSLNVILSELVTSTANNNSLFLVSSYFLPILFTSLIGDMFEKDPNNSLNYTFSSICTTLSNIHVYQKLLKIASYHAGE